MARSQLLRQNAAYFVGNVLALLLGYIYHFAAGRLLGPEGYAPVAAAFSLYFLLLVPGQMILTVAMHYAATFMVSGDGGQLRSVFRYLMKVTGMGSLLGLGIFLSVSPIIAAFLHIGVLTLLALSPTVLLIPLASVNRGVLQGEQRFVALSILLLADAAVRVVFAVAATLSGFGASGAVLGLGAGLGVGYALSFWPLRHLFTGRTGDFDKPHVLRFARSTTAAILGISFLFTADILLVKHFLDSQQAGIYASVSALGKLVIMATASITGVMFSRVTSLEARGLPGDRTLKASAGMVALVTIATVLIFGIAPGLVLLPFGPAFAAAAPYLPVFAVASGLFSLASLLCNYLLAVHDQRFVPVLGAAGIGEVTAIWNFHANLWQVITAVLVVGAATVIALWSLFISHRNRRTPEALELSPNNS